MYILACVGQNGSARLTCRKRFGRNCFLPRGLGTADSRYYSKPLRRSPVSSRFHGYIYIRSAVGSGASGRLYMCLATPLRDSYCPVVRFTHHNFMRRYFTVECLSPRHFSRSNNSLIICDIVQFRRGCHM